MGEQGDPGGRFQGKGEPRLSGGLEAPTPGSKQDTREKAVSYITAESSYLLLRNKLGVVGGSYAGLWLCNLQN